MQYLINEKVIKSQKLIAQLTGRLTKRKENPHSSKVSKAYI